MGDASDKKWASADKGCNCGCHTERALERDGLLSNNRQFGKWEWVSCIYSIAYLESYVKYDFVKIYLWMKGVTDAKSNTISYLSVL